MQRIRRIFMSHGHAQGQGIANTSSSLVSAITNSILLSQIILTRPLARPSFNSICLWRDTCLVQIWSSLNGASFQIRTVPTWIWYEALNHLHSTTHSSLKIFMTTISAFGLVWPYTCSVNSGASAFPLLGFCNKLFFYMTLIWCFMQAHSLEARRMTTHKRNTSASSNWLTTRSED